MSNKRRRRQQQTRSKPAQPQPKKAPINWGRWAGVAAAVLVVVGIVVLIMSGITTSGGPSGIPQGARSVPVTDRSHIEGSINYGVAVPAGGPHNPIWLNCGFYSGPVPPENAVHALEHAAVWITYRANTDEQTLDELRNIARSRRKVIVSEVGGQPTPLMATAWGWQLQLQSVDDERLIQFLNEFESSAHAPEPGGRCSGGVGSPS